jgi:hypothetical protein
MVAEGAAVALAACGDGALEQAVRHVAEEIGTSVLPLILQQNAVRRSWHGRIARVAGWRLFRDLDAADRARFSALFGALLNERRAAISALTRFCTTHLVCFEDGISGPAAMIGAARRLGLPIVVVPYEMSEKTDFENVLHAKARAGQLYPIGRDRRSVALRRSAPGWIRSYGGGDVTLLPPVYILARVRAGLPVQNPWTVHGGPADAIAVESSQMMQVYIAEKVPRQKLVLTGSPYCDAIAEVLAKVPEAAAAASACRKISPGTTRVLVSLPPSYHDSRGGECEWDDFADLWRALSDLEAATPGLKLSISMHPHSSAVDVDKLQRFGFRIEREWVVTAIARHDILLTCFSSIIRWALAAGKPVVNYDMYKFRLPPYANAHGFRNFERFADMAQHLGYLANDTNYEKVSRAMAAERSYWGVLDGMTRTNLVGLFHKLGNSRRVSL